MKIKLKIVNNEFISNKLKRSNEKVPAFLIQYADFNVINYLYENNFGSDELNNFFLYPDSTAVYFYLKFFQKKQYRKIISTDLQNNLLVELDKNSSRVYLFGDTDYILGKAKKNINLKFQDVKIVGSFNGYEYNSEEIISEINKNNVDILFVGLGVGRQEKWILENYKKLNVNSILSVGGWFQYLAENKKRAPLFLRKSHLEWLYKFIIEFPRVWKRYLIGVPKFYYRVVSRKIIVELIVK